VGKKTKTTQKNKLNQITFEQLLQTHTNLVPLVKDLGRHAEVGVI
jgi:hypothetical protein